MLKSIRILGMVLVLACAAVAQTASDAAFQRYRAAYVGKNKEMGTLRFIDMRAEVFGSDAAFVRGGWQLTMKDGKTRSGLFTVVLKKINDEWRIIHDHSS